MEYYSRGKLLISGEYLVLKGALALAVPLRMGQNLLIRDEDIFPGLSWESREKGQAWFYAKFELPDFDIFETNDQKVAKTLSGWLKAAASLNPGFAEKISGVKAIADLEFSRNWGFGSSSSLITNIADWAQTDAFDLHKLVSKGSGFDVVCARESGPVFFQKKKKRYLLKKVNIKKTISNHLFFVYLGKKQNSASSVESFLKKRKSYILEIREISELSQHMGHARNIIDFEYYIKEHEQIISSILRLPTLKETQFKQFEGEVKSLGAWGGDFALVTWTGTKKELKKYLENLKLEVLFSWNELVKSDEA